MRKPPRAVFIVWINNKEKIIRVGFTQVEAAEIFRNRPSVIGAFERRANQNGV
jgi:hypothetical protein